MNIKNLFLTGLAAIGLTALTARAQDISFISDDLVATNTFIQSGTTVSNLVSANYRPDGGFMKTTGLGTVSTVSQNETFQLFSAQFVGTNGTALIAPTIGTNYLGVQYALYLDDLALQYGGGITNIPGTTNPLPQVTIPIASTAFPATNYWTFTTNNGTIQTNKLFYAGYNYSSATLAATNFYGFKYYKVTGLVWVTTNAPTGAQLSVARLRAGHYVQGLSAH